MWGLPPNYKPSNPFAPARPDPEPPPVSDAVKQKARDNLAEFISKDGRQVYKWLYNKFYYADWDGFKFGSWFDWKSEELPADLIDIK